MAHHSKEVINEALRLRYEEDWYISDIEEKLGVPRRTLHRWYAKYGKQDNNNENLEMEIFEGKSNDESEINQSEEIKLEDCESLADTQVFLIYESLTYDRKIANRAKDLLINELFKPEEKRSLKSIRFLKDVAFSFSQLVNVERERMNVDWAVDVIKKHGMSVVEQSNE